LTDVDLLDIVPTILELMDINANADRLDGTPLLAWFHKQLALRLAPVEITQILKNLDVTHDHLFVTEMPLEALYKQKYYTTA
jgi:hypothetical protein